LTVGSVGINGGGEQLGGFNRSKLNQFFYIFYTQQSTAAMADCIACGDATPNPHDEASSQNPGAMPQCSGLVGINGGGEQLGGIRCWQNNSFFLHTTINYGYG
jgi:hypothetical protein